MDDFVLWSDSKTDLRDMLEAVREYVRAELRLELKTPVAGGARDGLPFLGFLVKRGGIFLLRKSKRRILNKFAAIKQELESGFITDEKAAEKALSVRASASLARIHLFMLSLWRRRRFGQ
jgi:hypothetical protein